MERLTSSSSVLLLVDVQEKLVATLEADARDRLLATCGLLLDAAQVLGVPVVVSEQYPKGLGKTVTQLAERLARMGVAPLPKVTFDAFGEPSIARVVAAKSPRQVVVAGMETHICVFQTVRELVRRDYETYVVSDAVASRTNDNRQAGLRLCETAGAFVSVAEAVIFDWTARAGTDSFKAISKLVK